MEIISWSRLRPFRIRGRGKEGCGAKGGRYYTGLELRAIKRYIDLSISWLAKSITSLYQPALEEDTYLADRRKAR